jgi:predicted CXXCH cytochrome family protein
VTRPSSHGIGSWLILVALFPSGLVSAQQAAQQPAQQPAQQSDEQPAQQPAGSCATCHSVLGDERLAGPAASFPEDIHAARGFGCSACHGGNPAVMGPDAMDPEMGYIGAPEPRQVPEVCGSCHSSLPFMRRFDPSTRVDQVSEYWTSVHGQRLAELNDPSVATCVSCHPAHSIRPAEDPQSSVHPLNVAGLCGSCHSDVARMADYGIPTDQREKYERSRHWQIMSGEGDLSAPTCNDCHGNHGAAPPGVSWVGNVCGQCHAVQGQLFGNSFKSTMFTVIGAPGCATCHGNHEIGPASDEMLGAQGQAVCTRCHTPESRGGQYATEMRSLIDSLQASFDQADSVLTRAEEAGMEVSQAQFGLRDATNSLIKARTVLHSFSVDSVRAAVDSGLEVTVTAREQGHDALSELRTRRVGLTVSAAIILVLIVGLVLKIREHEGISDQQTGR